MLCSDILTYPTGAPGPCSQFLVDSELLICFCHFVCMILVTLCSLLFMFVFHVRSLSLDYILLITTLTLVPLITYKAASWAIFFHMTFWTWFCVDRRSVNKGSKYIPVVIDANEFFLKSGLDIFSNCFEFNHVFGLFGVLFRHGLGIIQCVL